MSSSVSLEYLNERLEVYPISRTAMCAQNAGGKQIVVKRPKTVLPFEAMIYNQGFLVNEQGTEFMLEHKGTYFIQYQINTTGSLLAQSAVYKNDAALGGLTCGLGEALSLYSGSGIVSLEQGDILQLVLLGLEEETVLEEGLGAVLNLIRIS
ncbi:hypothetical protein LJC58_04840 [Lachnospiraceae bacterium OttesenSCG-928-D06]|nr:hypothetical protein [Lachnospiraceae bacterium OttesenSCG-928-D06]